MRPHSILAALSVVLLVPALADAQPTTYVCTPTAQVLTVDGTSGATAVLYTGSGSFDDCVLGPDGWLYVSNDFNILRFDPANPSGTDEFANTVALTSKARGLAFNLDTLYLNTASTGVWRLNDISKLDALGSHANPSASAVQSFALTTSGHGIAFDVPGNMVLASGITGASMLSAAPPYSSSAPLPTLPPSTPFGYPFGVAVNTCREVVFADKTSRTIKRLVGGVPTAITGLTFTDGTEFPVYVEIDSSNRMYVVTAADTAGSKAKVWRANPVGTNPLTACGSYTKTMLIKLQNLIPTLPALASNKALGIAIGPTEHTLTKAFSGSGPCTNVFDFGYHTLSLTFDTCPSVTVNVKASRSRPADVTFDSLEFSPSTHGIRYSPLGGFVLQYTLTKTPSTPLPPFLAKYAFFTQEPIGAPGVARTPNDALGAMYTENVTSDYWDVGSLDAAGGERGDDFSKRVVFNSGLAAAGSCTAGPFEEPLNTGNPLFNSGQEIKIAFTIAGAGCGNGTLHVSVVKIVGSGFQVEPVHSKGNAQTGNVMSISGGKYRFNLDTTGYGVGTYQITIWGDVIAPLNKQFTITQ